MAPDMKAHDDAQANAPQAQHYMKPGKLEIALLHRPMTWLNRHGIALNGKGVLAVRGRTSGEWRVTPVNPLSHQGRRYLVAPRGHTQWVRNLRAAGTGEIRVGKRAEPFTAVEVADADKPELLRTYLKRWGWEVGRFFGGVTAKSSDEELLQAAPKHPVFLITPLEGPAR
ncbi:nitroreductase family deazaflavin-dependent oxidoreductase [Streptomyces sp. N2-109]|uniref:Nitroreductase family deazaflavin-dependent oxidoreductase n=1 Tax=Streptomyces gossypii TaxID=2883101 RepID=A0ABT2JU01_9ACTN|nr:nitroreductase family deazaflavin-dependent oxidoreductase [Streptomyces gossypii]MCT2591359.1 nitroreductase family deazaflavin-dependent oxidoreductase [Streptomyces gossypii]